jgi:hypothetical protein
MTGAPDSACPRDHYALVFTILVVSYLLSALLPSSGARSVTLVLYGTALLIALRSARLSRRSAPRLRWFMAGGTLLAAGLSLLGTGQATEAVTVLWLATLVLVTVFVVVRRVVQHQIVSLQTVFGALSAYLLIGFMFAALFAGIAALDPRPFFAGGEPADSSNLQYFSFVTLTTTGYGDLAAANAPGRSLAAMEALLGQIFLVTLVARLVAVFGTVRPGPGERRPVSSAEAGGEG